MLLWFVIIYWIISVAIGIYAAKWVHNTKDFAIAGRQLRVANRFGRGPVRSHDAGAEMMSRWMTQARRALRDSCLTR